MLFPLAVKLSLLTAFGGWGLFLFSLFYAPDFREQGGFFHGFSVSIFCFLVVIFFLISLVFSALFWFGFGGFVPS